MTTNCNRTEQNPLTRSHTQCDDSIVIRCAAIDDLPAILELIHQKAEFDGCPEPVTATTEQLQADLFETRSLEVVLLVEVQGTIAGFVSPRFVSPRSQILSGDASNVALSLAFGRQSLRRRIPGKAWERELSVNQGQNLMRHLCQIAQQSGCERIDWTVATSNDRGIRFYKKMGAAVMDSVRLCRLDKQAIAQQVAMFQ
jgi:RimJ/RimL family protein N-acetyltransferase